MPRDPTCTENFIARESRRDGALIGDVLVCGRPPSRERWMAFLRRTSEH